MSNLEAESNEIACPPLGVEHSPPAQTLLPREVPLGGPRAMTVRRTLPHRTIRTIGAWCFIDDYGPSSEQDPPMDVRPHPHMGLQTVSWLLSGQIEHRDSTGGHGVVLPGQLNLMTAGHGIAHSEYAIESKGLRGVQMWIALPDAERDRTPGFAQHRILPTTTVTAEAGESEVAVTVIVGEFAGVASPAQVFTEIVGAQITAPTACSTTFGLRTDFEYGVLALDEPVAVDGEQIPAGAMRYLGWGSDSVRLEWTSPSSALLIGGTPLQEDLLMWWNFVGRTHNDIVTARAEWESGQRFGHVVGDPNIPLPAPDLPHVRMRARPGRT